MKHLAFICVLVHMSACVKSSEPDRTHDEYGCRYPAGYGTYESPSRDPDELREYEACHKFGWFEKGCKEIGGTMVGSACRRVRDGKAEYSGPSHLFGDYGLSENWWEDCKPHAAPYIEPGDPNECLTVESGDDPAKIPWQCVTKPPVWCPSNP